MANESQDEDDSLLPENHKEDDNLLPENQDYYRLLPDNRKDNSLLHNQAQRSERNFEGCQNLHRWPFSVRYALFRLKPCRGFVPLGTFPPITRGSAVRHLPAAQPPSRRVKKPRIRLIQICRIFSIKIKCLHFMAYF